MQCIWVGWTWHYFWVFKKEFSKSIWIGRTRYLPIQSFNFQLNRIIFCYIRWWSRCQEILKIIFWICYSVLKLKFGTIQSWVGTIIYAFPQQFLKSFSKVVLVIVIASHMWNDVCNRRVQNWRTSCTPSCYVIGLSKHRLPLGIFPAIQFKVEHEIVYYCSVVSFDLFIW